MKTTVKSYAELQAELHELIGRFESATETDIDQLLADYEQGIAVIKQLEERLKSAQLTIKTLHKKEESGQ